MTEQKSLYAHLMSLPKEILIEILTSDVKINRKDDSILEAKLLVYDGTTVKNDRIRICGNCRKELCSTTPKCMKCNNPKCYSLGCNTGSFEYCRKCALDEGYELCSCCHMNWGNFISACEHKRCRDCSSYRDTCMKCRLNL